MTEQKLSALLAKASDTNSTAVFDAYEKAVMVLEDDRAKTISVSISGGADSDLILDMVSRIRPDAKFVWFNTVMEYEATKRHLKYLEDRYGITIERVGASVPVPLATRRLGYPFLAKMVSENIGRLQRSEFDWSDRPFEELLSEFPNCKSALRWWCNGWGENSSFNIRRWKYLKEFLVENPPTFPISAGCCKGAKKDTAHNYTREHKVDLIVTGERKAEGGARAGASSCFTGAYDKGTAVFRPIFWLKDSDKEAYEKTFDICHSDCYTVYGLRRTGCVGCPFGRNWEQELEVAKQYEPKLHKMCVNVFRPSYEYTREYWKFRKHKEAQERGYEQLSLFE